MTTTTQTTDTLDLLNSLSNEELVHALAGLLEVRRERLDGEPRSEVVRELKWLQHVRNVADYHLNELATRAYDGKHPKHWLWKSHKQFILDRVKPGQRVLDVGCGSSAYLLWMAEAGSRVTACDIDPTRIELARSIMSHDNLSFEVRDAASEPPDETYDVVICSHVIEHLDDPVAMLAGLKRNAPTLVVCVPPDDNEWEKVMFRDLGLPWKDDEDHRREYTPDLLRDQLAAAGWRVDELHAGVDIKAVARAT